MAVEALVVRLMEEDGVRFAQKTGSEWLAHCFAHEDSNASMSINVTTGLYNCFTCGERGNTYIYLTQRRNLTHAEASKILHEEGEWTDDKITHDANKAREITDEKHRQRKGLPRAAKNIPFKSQGLPKVMEHEYHDEKGQLIVLVARYARWNDEKGKNDKKFLQFTPAQRGKWWACGPLADNLPPEDRRIQKHVLYRLSELLKGEKGSPIWVVEGETCVNAVLDTPMGGDRPNPLCTSLIGGSKTPLNKQDLSPLFGRNVLLLADGDKGGREFMIRLGAFLTRNGCNVKYVLPKGEDGYDIARAIGEGGWKSAAQWMKLVGAVKTPEIEKVNLNLPEKENGDGTPPLTDTQHFKVLGLEPDGLTAVFLVKKTNVILRRQIPTLHSEGNLITLAPLAFWQTLGEGAFNSAKRIAFSDELIRAVEHAGVIDGAKLPLGRGCINLDDGSIIFNLGNKFLCDPINGVFTNTRKLDESPAMLEPGSEITLVSSRSDEVEQYGRDLAGAIMKYRFESDIDARRLLGWMITALIGGALPFRPMLWLNAPSHTGKTFLVTDVLDPYFGNLLHVFNDPKPAGISQTVRSDSLPIIIDEFEPEKRNEYVWREILALIRSATSGKFERVRGTPQGYAISTMPRFSAVVSSINKPYMSEADSSRLIQCKLSRSSVFNWASVKKGIKESTTKDKMKKLRTHVIKSAPRIISLILDEQERMTEQGRIGTRENQIFSALTVGAGFLSGDFTSTWVEREEDEGIYDVLKHILGVSIRVPAERDTTLAESLIHALEQAANTENTHSFSRKIAEQHGVCFYLDEMEDQSCLLIAYESPQLRSLLRGSEFEGISLLDYLRMVPGAYTPYTESGNRMRKRFAGQQRFTIAIPKKTLMEVGFEYEDDYIRYL